MFSSANKVLRGRSSLRKKKQKTDSEDGENKESKFSNEEVLEESDIFIDYANENQFFGTEEKFKNCETEAGVLKEEVRIKLQHFLFLTLTRVPN